MELNKFKYRNNYTINIQTVLNGWLITIQTNYDTKNVVVQSEGKDRINEIGKHLDCIIEELEMDSQ